MVLCSVYNNIGCFVICFELDLYLYSCFYLLVDYKGEVCFLKIIIIIIIIWLLDYYIYSFIFFIYVFNMVVLFILKYVCMKENFFYNFCIGLINID